ncbi:MAG: GNAT family N-acetyltransferase [Haloarculaceae archaeon]
MSPDDPDPDGFEVRRARPEDYDAVVAFTSDTWPERGSDYIPSVYEGWMETEGGDQRTLVLDPVGEPGLAGILQGVLLSDHEAWAQAMRVNPDYRGMGVSSELTYALFDWAVDAGASVCRNMVFSWNRAGLGQSRSVGFEPVTEFRWAHSDPDPDAEAEGFEVAEDPVAAWTRYQGSDAAGHLRGLALDLEESWALSECTLERFRRAAAETASIALTDGERVRGCTYRVREYEREGDGGGTETWAEYGVGVWSDLEAARGLFAVVARDAASVGADRTRVLIPETPRHVSDAAYARAGISDEPDFVLAKDLAGRSS